MTHFIPFFGVLAVGFFVRFLGSEGSAIMTEGRNIVLLGVLILGLNFLFRLFFIRLKKRSRFLLLFFIILFYFLKYLYLYYPRVYLLSWFGPCLSGIFSTFIFFMYRGSKDFLFRPLPGHHRNAASTKHLVGMTRDRRMPVLLMRPLLTLLGDLFHRCPLP